MEITNVKAYRVAIESNRLDRYVEDVDSKILSKLKMEYAGDDLKNKISYEGLSSSTTWEMTLNTTKRINYLRVESDLFDKAVSYWFADGSEIGSNTAIKYKLTLDVFATYGKDFLNILRNKKINVKRYHEDRYLKTAYDSTTDSLQVEINPNNVSLIQSDFKLDNTAGQEKMYQQARTVITGEDKITVFGDSATQLLGVVENSISLDRGTWYKWGIIEILGDPSIVHLPPQGGNLQNIKLKEYVSNKINHGAGIDGLKMLVPIGRIASGTMSNNDFHFNSNNEITSLASGKLSSIFLSPIQFTDFMSIYETNITKDKYLTELKLYKGFEDVDKSTILAIDYSDLNNSAVDLELPNWNSLLKFAISGTKADVIAKLKERESETGIFNPLITSNEFLYKGDSDLSIKIDVNKYLQNSKVQLKALPDSQGVFININIADYHYAELDSKSNLNVVSDAGKTYLNNNRYQIEAQKEGARLSAKLQKKQIQSQQASTMAGGGIIGGFLSLINPTNWASTVLMENERDIADEIADNSIAKINGQIADAAAQAPSIKEGSGNSWKLANTFEEQSVFTYRLTRPNSVILDSIYYHYNKFGYKANKIVDVGNNDDLWKSRMKFNFLNIDNIKDYYNGELNVDDNVINLFQTMFKNGVRIWHQENIVYDNDNIERKISEL